MKKKHCTTQDELEEYIIQRRKYKEYLKTMRNFLLTSRFSNETWKENEKYRKEHPQICCVYCCPDPISAKIAIDATLFILEMNNTTNKIMGIGMIKNHPIVGKYRIYSDFNYNRYVYLGKYRIDRSNMTEYEDKIMQAFDILCFKGNTHMKRGQGLKSFPLQILFNCAQVIDLVEFITNMFKTRYASNSTAIKTNKN